MPVVSICSSGSAVSLSSWFCNSGLGAFLLMALPFLIRRLSGAGDACLILVAGIRVAVDGHQYDNRPDEAERMPPLFSAFDAIGENDVDGVVPDLSCQLEQHATLGRAVRLLPSGGRPWNTTSGSMCRRSWAACVPM